MLDFISVELVEVVGIAICFIVVLYAIATQEPPFSERLNHDKAEADKMKAYKQKQIYKRLYNYWFNKSYDHIDGMFKYGERDEYARRHALKDLDKYNFK